MDDTSRRYGTALSELLDRRGVKKRPLERKLGWSKGSLTKLFQGRTEMKVRQLLEILAAIGVAPLEFYGLVHGTPSGEIPVASRLLQSLDAHPAGQTPLVLPANLSREELEKLIEEAVHRALSRGDSPTGEQSG